MKTVTLGITTYGGAYLLEGCIKSIQKSVFNEGYSNVEVLVVNDGTPEVEAKMLRKVSKKYAVKYFSGRKNLGNVARYNTIVEESKGDIIVFVDNDVVIPDRWFTSVMCFFMQNEKVGVGSYLSQKVSEKDVVNLLAKPRITAEGSGRVPERATELAGYTFGFTRDSYKLAGGFDSDNFKYFIGDSDFCCRLAEKGLMSYRLLYPIVYHREHFTYNLYPELKAWNRAKQDLANFKKKWGVTPKEMEQKFLKDFPPQKITWYANYSVHYGWDFEVPGTLFSKEPVKVMNYDQIPRDYRSSDV